MGKKKKIILVDDHDIFRDGIKSLLIHENIADVVAEASNGQEFLDILDEPLPDIVLMDISMPVMDGIDATRHALELYPGLKVLVLSMFGDEKHYFEMINAGAKGFVLKSSGKTELLKAIDEVCSGESYFSSELLRSIILRLTKRNVLLQNNEISLTERESEVLQYICNGYSNNEIAQKLNLSPKTIDGHRTKLLSKTGARNSISLVMFAIKHKLVDM